MPKMQAVAPARPPQFLGGLALEHDLLDHRFPVHVVFLHGVGNLCLDQGRQHVARADRVGGDRLLGGLQCGGLGQADDAVLGGDIGAFVGRGGQTMRRGDVDDTSPAGGAHLRQRGSGGVKGRGQVDRDDRIPLLRRELVDRGNVLNAGVVDQDIAAACRLDQGAAFVRLGHVGLDIARLDAVFLGDGFRQGVILVGIGEGVDHHRGPCPCHLMRDAKADARVRSGDDGGLSL